MSEIYNETIKMTSLVQKMESEPKEKIRHFDSSRAALRSAALVFCFGFAALVFYFDFAALVFCFDSFARAHHTSG